MRRVLLLGLVALVLLGLVGVWLVAPEEWRARSALCRPVVASRLDRVVPGCGGVRDLLAGRAAEARNDLPRALERFRAAVAANARLTEAHTARGAAAEALGEFDEALAAYDAAARLAPSSAAYRLVGALADRMGQTDLALAWLERAFGTSWEHRATTVRAGTRAALWCLSERWSNVRALWTECPVLVGAVAHRALERMQEWVPQDVFRIHVEAGRRSRAIELAQRRGWVQSGARYCGRADPVLTAETMALLAMVFDPDDGDCLVDVGLGTVDDGLVRLGRLMLLDRAQGSQDAEARRRAERILRYRVPAHEVAKLAESLNVTGYRLQFRHRRPAEAAVAYRKAIAADPRFSWPYHNLGRIHLERNEAAEALAWIGKALEVNPHHWRAWRSYGAAAYGLKRYGEAEMAFRRALEIEPSDAATHADLGRALLKQGREGEGIRAFQTAVRLDPRLEAEKQYLASRLGREVRGATPTASVPSRPAVAADPNSALARSKSALTHGRYREALEEARRAADAAPQSVPALVARAGLAEVTGEFAEAATYYARAAALAPSDPGVLGSRASFAVRVGDYAEALRLLDALVAAHPWHVRLLFDRAPASVQARVLGAYPGLASVVEMRVDILTESGDLAGARRLARAYGIVEPGRRYCLEARGEAAKRTAETMFRAFRLAALGDPDDADCIWWYGQWLTDEGYVRLGRLMVAEGTRLTASAGNKESGARYLRIRLGNGREVPKRAEQLFLIGRQRYVRDGDAEGAARLFEEALRLAPGFARPHDYLARIAWEDGDTGAALAWLERGLAADPESWRTRRNLGQLLERLERYADAEPHLRRCVETFGDDVGGRLLLARVAYALGRHDAYRTHTRAALDFAVRFGNPDLGEVRDFLEKTERWGPGASLPPAPDPRLIIGWNRD
jgi:tetratricopeptide (TPR) repeat protein